MKFTIVTPSYNKGPYLKRTIQSVLSQIQSNIEIEYFVYDNHSTDETQAILTTYQTCDKLHIVRYADKGQFDAINQGWLKSTGDILGWLNADDVYLEKALNQVADFFIQNPDVMAIYGEAIYLDAHDITLKPVTNIRDYSRQRLLSHDFITQPATFIRREVFEEVGLLSNRYRYIFDWEYWIRISQKYDFVRVPALLAGYRVTDDNLTTTGGGKRFREMIDLVWRYGGVWAFLQFSQRLSRKYALGEPEIPPI